MKKVYEENDIKNIADAIREKNGETTKYKTNEMAQAIKDIPSGGGEFDISQFRKLDGLFSGNNDLISLPKEYSKLCGKNITSLANTFSSCMHLNDISILANWDTSNVTSMTYLFNQCYELTDLSPITNWDTSKVTNLAYLFYRNGTGMLIDEKEKKLDLSPLKNWNTSNVTNMSYVFNEVYRPRQIDYDEDVELNWNCTNATNMNYFLARSNLTNPIPVKGIFTGLYSSLSKSVSLSCSFKSCAYLTQILLPNFNKNVTRVDGLFQGCKRLELIDIRGLVVSSITTSSYYTNALTDVPTTVKIIVKDQTEKNWWTGKYGNWSSCFYTVEEAIAAGIIEK